MDERYEHEDQAEHNPSVAADANADPTNNAETIHSEDAPGMKAYPGEFSAPGMDASGRAFEPTAAAPAEQPLVTPQGATETPLAAAGPLNREPVLEDAARPRESFYYAAPQAPRNNADYYNQNNYRPVHESVLNTESNNNNYYDTPNYRAAAHRVEVIRPNAQGNYEADGRVYPTPVPQPEQQVEQEAVAARSRDARKRRNIAWALVVIFCSALSLFVGAFLARSHYQMQSMEEQLRAGRQKPQQQEQRDNVTKRGSGQPAVGPIQPYFSLEDAASRTDEGRKPLKIWQIAALGQPAVVAISTEQAMQTPFGNTLMPVAGSGFLISKDGYIVTNNHVIEKSTSIKVRLQKGNKESDIYEASLVGADPLSDLAVIKIEPKHGEVFPFLTFGKSSELKVGELAVAIGNPTGSLEGSVSAGIISALARDIQVEGNQMTLIQTDTAINSGNSGGALLNSFGEVIGINTAKLQGVGNNVFEGLGFAIPSDYAKPIIQDLIRYGYLPDRVYIGIQGESVDADLARYYQIADQDGIYVRRVIPNSPAAKAKLQEGDFIISVNGKKVDSVSALNNIKKTLKPGDEVKVGLIRDHQQIEVPMTLQGQPKPEH